MTCARGFRDGAEHNVVGIAWQMDFSASAARFKTPGTDIVKEKTRVYSRPGHIAEAHFDVGCEYYPALIELGTDVRTG